MEKIAVITDSTCDLEETQLRELNIHVLPLKVIYHDGEYTDRVDITPEEVYRNLHREIPKTSMPSPGEVHSLFSRLKQEGVTNIISIHISGGLSGTAQMIGNIAAQFPDLAVKVLDSKSLSMGVGFPVLEAARAVKSGQTFEQVVALTEKVIRRVKTLFVVGTLEYLIKGGRIGYISGTIGELLNIKPIVSINDEGKYFTLERARGRKKSLERLYEIVRDEVSAQVTRIAVCHGDAETEARALLDKLKELPNIRAEFFGQIGPVMGVHSGPGLVGVVLAP